MHNEAHAHSGFMSYARRDDKDHKISELCELLKQQISVYMGQDFEIFQDIHGLASGDKWPKVIEDKLHESSVLFVVLSPSFYNSAACRKEVTTFVTHKEAQGLPAFILPINYVELGPLEEDLERDSFVRDLRVHQWIDWTQLRVLNADDPEIRRTLQRVASHVRDKLVARAPAVVAAVPNAVQDALGRMGRVLDEIRDRVESTRITQGFRAEVMHRVISAARDEIESLSGPENAYQQDLSLEENFIVRAMPIFQEAHNVYAISIDELSAFWISPDQRSRAEAYTEAQPRSTIRLFVFSTPQSAHQYRNVMAAHHGQYGAEGAVLFCSKESYHKFLSQIATREELEPVDNRDFAVLVYRDGASSEFYEATLSRTRLECRRRKSLDPYQQRLTERFEELRRTLEPGEIADGIIRWSDAFRFNPEGWDDGAWRDALDRAFEIGAAEAEGVVSGSVYHLVFISAGVASEKVLDYVDRVVRPRLRNLRHPVTGEQMVDDVWFGTRTGALEVLDARDGRYGGELRTRNELVQQFPNCLVMRFRNLQYLHDYYQDNTHSELREELYRLCDPNIGMLFDLFADDQPADTRNALFYAVEGAASRVLSRADYVQESALHSIVAEQSVPFGPLIQLNNLQLFGEEVPA